MLLRRAPLALALAAALSSPAALAQAPTHAEAVAERVIALVDSHYVFEDQKAVIAGRVRAGLDAGRYQRGPPARLARGRADPRPPVGDRRPPPLRPTRRRRRGGEPDWEAWAERERIEERTTNHGFPEARVLDGNVGYLRVAGWAEPQRGYDAAVAAMTFLENTDALVIDVRGNGGGYGGLAELIVSYFFDPPPTLLTTTRYSDPAAPPSTLYSLPFVPGERRVGDPLFVLIDEGTGSASESIAYTLQAFGKAVVAGEPSHGSANRNTYYDLGGGLRLSVSTGTPVNAIHGDELGGGRRPARPRRPVRRGARCGPRRRAPGAPRPGGGSGPPRAARGGAPRRRRGELAGDCGRCRLRPARRPLPPNNAPIHAHVFAPDSARLLCGLLLLAGCASPPRAGDVIGDAPARPDPSARYLFYLHGRIIEDEGERPTHPQFGTYEYRGVLQALADSGFVVISEPRDPGTDVAAYAEGVVERVRGLLDAGVPAEHVTVVGFSKGGGIAVHTSTQLAEPEVRFALLAACGDGVFDPSLRVSGRILSVVEATDELAAPSCGPLFTHARDVRERSEVTVETGERHGAFYRPRTEWLGPVVTWARGEGLAKPGPDLGALGDRLRQLAEPAGGRVGIGVALLGSDEVVTVGGDRHPMQSVFKLPLGMAVLAAVDRGDLALDQAVRVTPSDFVSIRQHSPIRDRHPDGVDLTVERLLRAAASGSDGTAADVLLGLVGGPAAVTAHLRSVGVEGVEIAVTEKDMGRSASAQYRNWATPAGALAVLQALHEGRGLSHASRAHLFRLLTETRTGPNRIRGRLPDGTDVAHKTGSSRTVDGVTAATNDIGIVPLPDGRRLAVAVFVSDSPADDAVRERVVADAARAAYDAWAAAR